MALLAFVAYVYFWWQPWLPVQADRDGTNAEPSSPVGICNVSYFA